MMKIVDNDGFKDLRYYGETVLSGTVIYELVGTVLDHPTRTSIQIGPNEHIEDDLGQYINHSCEPSVKVIYNKLITLKDIEDRDSITFNYNISETDMSNPFSCHCCNKLISGKVGLDK